MPACIKVCCIGFFESRVRLLRPRFFRVVELLILATEGTVILIVLIVGILFIELIVGLNVGLLEIVVILEVIVFSCIGLLALTWIPSALAFGMLVPGLWLL